MEKPEDRIEEIQAASDHDEVIARSNFLRDQRRWSMAVISGVALGTPPREADNNRIDARGSWVRGGAAV